VAYDPIRGGSRKMAPVEMAPEETASRKNGTRNKWQIGK